MKLLMKEWKLCMHPFGYITPLLSVLVLVPGYPYGVCCFYMALAIYFICLTARENHDAAYTLTLPVTRREAVHARILFSALLEILQMAFMGLFMLLRKAILDMPNPAGLDAGLAMIGEGFLIFALFNMIFFPAYYRDINKPGRAFVFRNTWGKRACSPWARPRSSRRGPIWQRSGAPGALKRWTCPCKNRNSRKQRKGAVRMRLWYNTGQRDRDPVSRNHTA